MLFRSGSAELKKAIISVMNGEDYIQPSLIPVLNSKMIDRNHDNALIEELTRRELQVLKLLAVGKYNKEVAEELEIPGSAGVPIPPPSRVMNSRSPHGTKPIANASTTI